MEQHVVDQAILKVGGAEFVLVSHKFIILQSQQNGRPFGRPKIERFRLKVESDGDNAELMNWGTESTKKLDGSIDFMSAGALVAQITFKGAYCVSYSQTGAYDFALGKSSLIEKLEVIPTSLTWNDCTYEAA